MLAMGPASLVVLLAAAAAVVLLARMCEGGTDPLAEAGGEADAEGDGAPASPGGGCRDEPEPGPHAALEIEEVDFRGNHTINEDGLNDLPSPEWLRDREDQYPVCYTRNTTAGLRARFRVTRQPAAAESVEIRGRAVFGREGQRARLNWTATVQVSPSDTEVSTSDLTSAGRLPNCVDCYDPRAITWEANPAGSGWTSAGTSSHTWYVVLGDPVRTPNFWTCLDLSCRAAAGAVNEQNLVYWSFRPFDSLRVIRKRDDLQLGYWTGTSSEARVRNFLRSDNGSGQCGAWAELLIHTWRSHGVDTQAKVFVARTLDMAELERPDAEGFLIKHWRFVGNGTGGATYRWRCNHDCIDEGRIPSQNYAAAVDDLPNGFYNHFIVLYEADLFDPSYGVVATQPSRGSRQQRLDASKLEWENGAIDGLFSEDRAGLAKAGRQDVNLLRFRNTYAGGEF